MPKIDSIDHIVLTAGDMDRTIDFYTRVLGMEVTEAVGQNGKVRKALSFGIQKINLHQAGAEFEPKARTALPGTVDVCFLSTTPLDAWQSHLGAEGVAIELGPIEREGAVGPMMSIYMRDPDGNLVEIANPLSP